MIQKEHNNILENLLEGNKMQAVPESMESRMFVQLQVPTKVQSWFLAATWSPTPNTLPWKLLGALPRGCFWPHFFFAYPSHYVVWVPDLRSPSWSGSTSSIVPWPVAQHGTPSAWRIPASASGKSRWSLGRGSVQTETRLMGLTYLHEGLVEKGSMYIPAYMEHLGNTTNGTASPDCRPRQTPWHHPWPDRQSWRQSHGPSCLGLIIGPECLFFFFPGLFGGHPLPLVDLGVFFCWDCLWET